VVILITGASCVGKTFLAQKLMEKYKIPYFSLDHLKMGIYRSNKNCGFTPESPDEIIIEKLWTITREVIKTNIENNQNIIIEGCYFPNSIKDLENEYYEKIIYFCICFSEQYIRKNIETKIYNNRSIIEYKEEGFIENIEKYILENKNKKNGSKNNSIKYFEIKENYEEEMQNVCDWIDNEIENIKN
jgi:putative acetyltransferase